MTEIDNLSRITLANLKWLFKNARTIRGQVRKLIDENKPSEWWEYLDLKEGYLSKMGQYLRGTLSFGDWITLEVEASIELDTMEIGSLLFKWNYNGSEYSQRVSVEARPSNLGVPEPVYYFRCPYSGRICRKLYFDGIHLLSRYAFPHTYSKRNQSHRQRDFYKYMGGLFYSDDATHRKETYRGKLTPHGKKMAKILGLVKDQERLREILFANRDRGRPRKDG